MVSRKRAAFSGNRMGKGFLDNYLYNEYLERRKIESETAPDDPNNNARNNLLTVPQVSAQTNREIFLVFLHL